MKVAVSPYHGRRCFHLKIDFLYETMHEKGKLKAMMKNKKDFIGVADYGSSFYCHDADNDGKHKSILKVIPDFYLLENDYIKVSIHKKTGFIKDIYNKKTGISHKSGGAGNWPFQITLGNQTAVGISGSTKIKYRQLR